MVDVSVDAHRVAPLVFLLLSFPSLHAEKISDFIGQFARTTAAAIAISVEDLQAMFQQQLGFFELIGRLLPGLFL